MHATGHEVDTLNALLRGEIAATETYQQAMQRLHAEPGVAELTQIHVEHRSAANTLRQHVHHHGGKPDQGSGAWGAWAKLVEGTATVFGKAAALKALKEGEEQGISDYQEALADANLPADCKELIRTQLLPQTQRHLRTLARIMAS